MTRIIIVAALWLILVSDFAQRTQAAQVEGRKSYTFTGVVERVDVPAGTMTVRGDEVKGWMAAMTMLYRVDRPAVLTSLDPGDLITATVYEGNVTTLYNVREVAPRVEALSAPGNRAATPGLPPIVYACPTPGESAIQDKPGTCPTSGAPLVPVRLAIAYSCLKVTLFIREAPGPCPVDRTPMVPVTASLYFTCKDDQTVRELGPGRCANGAPREKAFDRIPHGDHNPRHGGTFFMAADQWHHLEGTLVAPDVFRVYFYDDLSRPFVPTGFSASVMRTDQNGMAIGRSVPLHRRGGDRTALESAIGKVSFPVNLQLRLRFKSGEREQIFDFTFGAYSLEP